MTRAILMSILLAACKAGTVTEGDQTGLAKPVETDRSQPLPGEGAASPTTSAEPASASEHASPTDTPAAANTEPEDRWPETSTDPWAPTKTKEESVMATPALEDPANPEPTVDPLAPASTDPRAPLKPAKKPTKRIPTPIR
jgi:hypothetical protein